MIHSYISVNPDRPKENGIYQKKTAYTKRKRNNQKNSRYSKRNREVPKEYALLVVSKLAYFGRNKDYVAKHSPFALWLRIAV